MIAFVRISQRINAHQLNPTITNNNKLNDKVTTGQNDDDDTHMHTHTHRNIYKPYKPSGRKPNKKKKCFSHTQINRRKMINHSDLWSVLYLSDFFFFFFLAGFSFLFFFLLPLFLFFNIFIFFFPFINIRKNALKTHKHPFWFPIPDDC